MKIANPTWRLGLVLALALSGLAVWADASSGGVHAPVVFAGPITAASSTSITVQGIPVALASTTQIFGLDSGGLLVTLTPADLVVDETVTVYAQDAENAATADVVFAGLGFHISGEVTALVTDTSGPTQVTLDGIFVVDVSHAVWLSTEEKASDDSGSVQVGSEVELWGIANNGAFVAAFGQNGSGGGQGGGAAMENGFILVLTTDSQGALSGFSMTSKGTVFQIVLDPSTVVAGKGSSTADLKAGLHVKVWGIMQSDGSVLASKIVIKGGSRS